MQKTRMSRRSQNDRLQVEAGRMKESATSNPRVPRFCNPAITRAASMNWPRLKKQFPISSIAFTQKVDLEESPTDMKNILQIGLCALAIGACVTTFAQAPVITSFSQNGVLVCSNLMAGSVATVEWASSLSGPWNTNWAGLDAVTAGSNGMIQVSVPMFYRVRGAGAPTNTVPANMVLIPAGLFQMGDSLDGETDALPLHSVYVSAFYMDTNLVSYALWQQVYQWATSHGYSFDFAGSGKAANHPVQHINWYDCVKWCNARSEMEGRTPAYYTGASQTVVYRSGAIDLSSACVNCSAGYRLPTEAEWEKAARGGLSGDRFPWGNTIDWSHANYFADPVDYSYDINPTSGSDPAFNDGVMPYTSPVGYFAPNGYGLHDMAGNVWGWCWDWYGSYSSGSQSDPRGASSGSRRVNRGGCWDGYAFGCRAARRYADYPTFWDRDVGFRSVLPPGQP